MPTIPWVHWKDWYSSAGWRKRRAFQLHEHPLCRICLERGKVEPATVADHIEPHHGDINKFRLGDLQSLCKACHDGLKRTVEIRGYSTAIGPDGMPVDPQHPCYRHRDEAKALGAPLMRFFDPDGIG